MCDLFAYVTEAILAVAKVLRLRKPGPVFLYLFNETDGMLEFKLLLPPAGAQDVVTREVRLMLGDTPVEFTLDKNDRETGIYQAEDNTVISGSLVDVDDAGNRSEVREFSFTLTDTIAPPQPGEIGLEVVGEFETETPPEDPTDPTDPIDPEPVV